MREKTIVVVARSARMLVQMAVYAGWEPIAIDCFADEDTRRLARLAIAVPSLAAEVLLPVLERIVQHYDVAYWVYGSGFEQCPDTLVEMARLCVVLGNSPEIFQCFQDKVGFFETLRELEIPHPETVFEPPVTTGPWLQKPYCGEGGTEIVYLHAETVRRNEVYWQRWLPGDAGSLTFLAHERGCEILGFNHQWTCLQDNEHPFVFVGIVNHARFDRRHVNELRYALGRLVSVYRLRGLGSLDFIISDGRCYILELNARIPASAQLYGRHVFDWHVDAVLGREQRRRRSRYRPRGYQIVFAPRNLTIPADVDWPEWVMDIPPAGAIIGQGQPICSIMAGGKNAGQVRSRLQQRQTFVQNILFTGC